jgi:hypothetical protein
MVPIDVLEEDDSMQVFPSTPLHRKSGNVKGYYKEEGGYSYLMPMEALCNRLGSKIKITAVFTTS